MDTLADTLWQEFASESEDHLQAAEPIIVAADRRPVGAEEIAQLFRSFHSIKGLARAMELPGMESLAHHAEDLLGLVRDGRAVLSAGLADLLLLAVDGLRRMCGAAVEQRHDVPGDPGLVARLAEAFARAGGTAPPPPPAPAHPPGGAQPLQQDPEMVAIFVEMVAARGPELCDALAASAAKRAAALDAAETLAHAAEVMDFAALAASFAEFRDVLRPLAAGGTLDEPLQLELLARLGDIRVQIDLVGEVTGRDAGSAAFSAALRRRIDAADAVFARLAAPVDGGSEDLDEDAAAQLTAGLREALGSAATPGRLIAGLRVPDEPLRVLSGEKLAAGAAASPGGAGGLIRVRGEVVDALLDDIGELRAVAAGLTHLIRGVGSRAIVARARAFVDRLPPELRLELQASFGDFRERDRRLLETEERISRMLSRLHQSALELRVIPVDLVFSRLPRLVRDLAQPQGKAVELVLGGREVRIDRGMVEMLADPLIHMVRNAVDHGIEPPEERRAAGKPETGRLDVRAAQRGSEIHIEIADDGRGLDAAAIRARAVARGLASAADVAALPDAEVFQFIFAPGLSTAAAVTETSGRGVGMDIVLATVRRLDGDIDIRSEPGRGTAFTLRLPLSAVLQTALIVRIGEQSLAIPERYVTAVAEIETEAIRLVGSRRSVLHRQAVLPLFDLGNLLGLRDCAPPGERRLEPVVIATNGRQRIGLEVDALEQRQELFLKELDPRLANFPGVGGASVLGDGRVVLVLDGEELLQLAARGIAPTAAAAGIAS